MCQLRDRGKLYASSKTFETENTRKHGYRNTRNGPVTRTRPPTDLVNFQRNLGVFRNRCSPSYLSLPLSNHTLTIDHSNVVRGYRCSVRAVAMIAACVRRCFDFRPMFARKNKANDRHTPGSVKTMMITSI